MKPTSLICQKTVLLKIMRKLALVVLLLISNFIFSQSKSEIGKYLESSNTEVLIKHFGESIELSILNSSGVYNINQAEVLLTNFFTTYPPEKYFVKHQGGNPSKKYYEIGKLLSSKGNFRTYFLYDIVEEEVQIIELRIENTE